jgi:hypothetical protein
MKVYYWRNIRNNRYFLAIRGKDLFDDLVITNIAGGAKCIKGRKLLTMPLATRKEAADHIRQLKKIRNRNGYNKPQLIDYNKVLNDVRQKRLNYRGII